MDKYQRRRELLNYAVKANHLTEEQAADLMENDEAYNLWLKTEIPKIGRIED